MTACRYLAALLILLECDFFFQMLEVGVIQGNEILL